MCSSSKWLVIWWLHKMQTVKIIFVLVRRFCIYHVVWVWFQHVWYNKYVRIHVLHSSRTILFAPHPPPPNKTIYAWLSNYRTKQTRKSIFYAYNPVLTSQHTGHRIFLQNNNLTSCMHWCMLQLWIIVASVILWNHNWHKVEIQHSIYVLTDVISVGII